MLCTGRAGACDHCPALDLVIVRKDSNDAVQKPQTPRMKPSTAHCFCGCPLGKNLPLMMAQALPGGVTYSTAGSGKLLETIGRIESSLVPAFPCCLCGLAETVSSACIK